MVKNCLERDGNEAHDGAPFTVAGARVERVLLGVLARRMRAAAPMAGLGDRVEHGGLMRAQARSVARKALEDDF